MYSIKRTILIALLISCFASIVSCKKYLDAKSNQKLVILKTVQDLQAILDYYIRVNQLDPSASERSADNYYLTYSDWSGIIQEDERNMYIWKKDNLFPPGGNNNDWSFVYDNVYRSNLVLYNINKVKRTPNDQNDWNNVKGHALFTRAKAFLQAAFIWAVAYDSNSAGRDLGLPLRLDPDFNKVSVRSSIQQTYDQIIRDLMKSIPLLPVTPIHLERPSKPAAYALLARTYLSMRKYDSAFKYSDLCLKLKNDLMDYNDDPSVMPASSYRIARFNREVIMDNLMSAVSLRASKAKVDSILYQSYEENDLRKEIFFKMNKDSTYRFAGSYTATYALFDGIATDEVYLMRAECYARLGNISKAMDDLNALLIKRWKAGTFTPFSAGSSQEAISIILTERRKELIFRGLRWMDIKRLNKEGANITLRRVLNGEEYTLPPNDPRFALPIPESVIKLSGIKQNPR